MVELQKRLSNSKLKSPLPEIQDSRVKLTIDRIENLSKNASAKEKIEFFNLLIEKLYKKKTEIIQEI